MRRSIRFSSQVFVGPFLPLLKSNLKGVKVAKARVLWGLGRRPHRPHKAFHGFTDAGA